MSELSQNTKSIVHALYKSREALEVCDILENECGTEALSCDGWSPTQMERIRFAVIQLAKENSMSLDSAIELAQKDWRDLLMVAGFGNELNAHNEWAAKMLTNKPLKFVPATKGVASTGLANARRLAGRYIAE